MKESDTLTCSSYQYGPWIASMSPTTLLKCRSPGSTPDLLYLNLHLNKTSLLNLSRISTHVNV